MLVIALVSDNYEVALRVGVQLIVNFLLVSQGLIPGLHHQQVHAEGEFVGGDIGFGAILETSPILKRLLQGRIPEKVSEEVSGGAIGISHCYQCEDASLHRERLES